MTDLERDWDDLPTGPAPVDIILREARREAARGRRTPEQRLRRSLRGALVRGEFCRSGDKNWMEVQNKIV